MNCLKPRTELFALATYARALAAEPGTWQDQATALRAFAAEYTDAAQYWTRERDHPTSARALVLDARQEAEALALPPLDTSNVPALLLDAAVTSVRNVWLPGVAVSDVELTAMQMGNAVEWANIAQVVTRYSDGTERTDITYPMPALRHFLWDLAELRPPAAGDTLTLRVTPGPTGMPPLPAPPAGDLDWDDIVAEFGLGFFGLEPLDDDAPASAPEPEREPAPAPEPVKRPRTVPAADDHAGWVWWHVDRSHVKGTVTKLRVLNNGGRSKLDVIPLDGTHKGMAPTLNRQIDTDLTEETHRYFRATYGARRLWPTHVTLTRPADQPVT
ncbi:hypothetical protein ACIQ9R_36165 [Streptomyces sp. NPDC094447]|uniref:hypothetical protein n=1 Tax=Streptomyces sp. NPDC094447 TaxID=3366062 RepID=UPI00380B585D